MASPYLKENKFRPLYKKNCRITLFCLHFSSTYYMDSLTDNGLPTATCFDTELINFRLHTASLLDDHSCYHGSNAIFQIKSATERDN